MKQKFKRFLAGFMAMLTIFTTFATSGTTAFAASPQANMKIWFASPRATGEISELKAGYEHGRMFYHWIDGHASYCLNYSLSASNGQLMTSYDEPQTNINERTLKRRKHSYGGTVVNMSTYTDNYVNPLAMDVWNLDQNDTKGWVREKGEFMLGLCEQCIGDSLNSRQKSIIDRCVRKLYIDIARSREKYIPIMSDFYDLLLQQPEEEAKDIALSLELFVSGSLNIFNHQTNVDVDNRFTVYGIRDLGADLSPITMLVMLESIQQRIVENGKKGKATWLYIDEFHVLLNSEYSAKYLQQLWKKVRKQGGLCTGITQNVVDLLQNYTATTMLANSEFVALLKQANTDSSKMAEVIGVSEAQLRFVTNTASGMGLIKCGSVVIPFDNQISKDTDLYKLYNTNIHELIEEKKKREAGK